MLVWIDASPLNWGSSAARAVSADALASRIRARAAFRFGEPWSASASSASSCGSPSASHQRSLGQSADSAAKLRAVA